MDGIALRLALAAAFTGNSAALGKQLRRYPDIETAWQDRQSWQSQETPERRQRLAHCSHADYLDYWLPELTANGWQLVALGDADYPPLLAQLTNAPGVLFVRGEVSVLQSPQLAMVGSRAATAEGKGNAERLSAALAAAGFTITSGLAAGVDAAAHRGALKTGKTLAVMGTGPDRIYPRNNKMLADKIVANGGALVTEFAPGAEPKPFHFPQRNRVISGLSLGVVVVEAAIKSGSLITAKLAMKQGKEVFALPGSLRNPLSRGCHQLLRDGANWLEEVDDVVAVLGSMRQMANAVETDLFADADQPELLTSFTAGINRLEELQQRSGLLLTDLLESLADLELDGHIEKLPGGYQRSG